MLKSFQIHAFWLAIILGLTIFNYAPALDLPFRDPDQMNYFAELKGDYSFSNAVRFLDYGLTRTYWKGDEILYRPLLFTWLALQSHFFQNHHFYWNLANLLLHMAILALLYFFLFKISPVFFAGLFTLLFAVSPAPIGLVLNPHLGGYLWAYFWLTAALHAFIGIIRDSGSSLKNKVLFAIFTGIGCFFHEFLLFACVAALFFFCMEKRFHSSRLFAAAPILVYFIFYAMRDFTHSEHLFFVFQQGHSLLPDAAKIFQLPEDIRRILSDFVLDIFPDKRTPKIFLIVAFATLFLRGRDLELRRLLKAEILFPFFLLGLYVLLTAYFRGTFFRDYYQHLFFLLLTIGTFILPVFHAFGKIRTIVSSLFLLALIIPNALNTHAYLKNRTLDYQDVAAYHKALAQYVDKHKQNQNFSFSIHNPDAEIDWQVHLALGYPDRPTAETFVNASNILFAPYIKKDSPQTLVWDREKTGFMEENTKQ